MSKRKHTLFVCIGNICRSAMAEAFARKYGTDVMVSSSAGLAPAQGSHPTTRSVLLEKNVEMGEHVPRRFTDVKPENYDLIVNMSGQTLPAVDGVRMETWPVADPMGRSDETFRKTRDEIEMLVMNLILRIRTGKFDSQAAGPRQ